MRLRLGWLQGAVALAKAPCANSCRYLCEHIDAVELNAKVAMFLGEGKEEAVGPVHGCLFDGSGVRDAPFGL